MVLSATSPVPTQVTTRPPRFFTRMAPGWALYAMAVFVLSSLAGLAGWMMQQGLQRRWTLLTVIGLGTQVGGLALFWQRHAWHSRVRRAYAASSAPPQVERIDRRVGRTAQGFLWVGAAFFVVGVIETVRTRKLPTLP